MLPPQPNFLTLACGDVERMADFLEVDAAYEAPRSVDGAELLGEPSDSPHGFRGFGFRDPEGNLWDVVCAFDSTVAPDGSLTWSA